MYLKAAKFEIFLDDSDSLNNLPSTPIFSISHEAMKEMGHGCIKEKKCGLLVIVSLFSQFRVRKLRHSVANIQLLNFFRAWKEIG